MATKEIKICDCCKAEAEKNSDDGRGFGIAKLDFKDCYRIQTNYTKEFCGLCAAKIEKVIKDKLDELRK